MSAKPENHNGPFEFVETFLDGDWIIAIERCRGCGNIVLRWPKDKTDPGTTFSSAGKEV